MRHHIATGQGSLLPNYEASTDTCQVLVYVYEINLMKTFTALNFHRHLATMHKHIA